MAKGSKERPRGIEIQNGPIRMEKQYTSKFQSEERRLREDIRENELRVSGQTLTLHEPKR